MGWSDTIPGSLGAAPRDPSLAPEDLNLTRWTNFLDAIQKLSLTTQEQNLYKHHLNNMAAGRQVVGPEGTSTILQVNVKGPGGRYYDVPTVWDGKILSPAEGVKRAVATNGWDHWPSYETPNEADSRYMQYHEFMGQDIPHQAWDVLYEDR